MTNFNPAPPLVMHIDFNSCFASIEQQANPLLRGKPVVVAAYASPKGCILAASREAKALGKIKTGMQVQQARTLIPNLIVLEPDSMKYRTAHRALYKLLLSYTSDVEPKSIDEFVCHFQGFKIPPDLISLGLDIKNRIKLELGEYLTVSIGFGPNRFLAKQAAIFKKPDGLEIISQTNFLNYYSALRLTDLNGIAGANQHRLNWQGIYSVTDMYSADLHKLKRAFGGIVGYYWYLRLRGYEIDKVVHHRSMFGSMYSLPRPAQSFLEANTILTKLVEKATLRMQKNNFSARSMSLWLHLKNKTYFHQTQTLKEPLFSSLETIRQAGNLLKKFSFISPITKLSFSLFNLEETKNIQYSLFVDTGKSFDLSRAVVSIKDKWGQYGVVLATMLNTQSQYKDFIGFGNIKDIDYELLPESFSKELGLEEPPEETW